MINGIKVFFVVLIALYLLVGVLYLQPRPSYAETVNETLDMVLLVGSETCDQDQTWGDIEREVARRLNVVRHEPWSKL